jgi:hypothetical protein
LVRKKSARNVPALAETRYPHAIVFALKGAVATPDALVNTVIVAVPLLKVPLAPTPGAVNVTMTLGTGLLPESFTVTPSAFANALFTVADCGVVPGFMVIDAGAPSEFVNEKLTVVSPADAAVTV